MRVPPTVNSTLLALVAVAAVTGRARSQTVNDEGLWVMVMAQGDLGEEGSALDDFRWWLDVQPRYTDAAGGLRQMLIRPGLGYAVADNASVWLGYAWVQTDAEPAGQATEDRLWEQLLWSPDIEFFNLVSRTRLEQRLLDTGDDLGWRFRQFFKITPPLTEDRRLFVSVYEEAFFDLNDTDWGQRGGFSQNRLFAGLGWRFDAAGRFSTEVGYLNQFIDRRGDDDLVNHLLSVNFFLTF